MQEIEGWKIISKRREEIEIGRKDAAGFIGTQVVGEGLEERGCWMLREGKLRWRDEENRRD